MGLWVYRPGGRPLAKVSFFYLLTDTAVQYSIHHIKDTFEQVGPSSSLVGARFTLIFDGLIDEFTSLFIFPHFCAHRNGGRRRGRRADGGGGNGPSGGPGSIFLSFALMGTTPRAPAR